MFKAIGNWTTLPCQPGTFANLHDTGLEKWVEAGASGENQYTRVSIVCLN